MEKKNKLSKFVKVVKKNKQKEEKIEKKKVPKKVLNDKELKDRINKEVNFRNNINNILEGNYKTNILWQNLISMIPNWDKKTDDEKKIFLFKETIKKLQPWDKSVFKNKFEYLPINMMLDFMKYYKEQIQKEKDEKEQKAVLYIDVLNNWIKTEEVKQVTEQYISVSGNTHTFESLDNIGKKELLHFVEEKKIEVVYPESYKKEFKNNLSPSLLNYHALIYQISRNMIESELEDYKDTLIKLSTSKLNSKKLIDKYNNELNKLNKSLVNKKQINRVEIIKYIKDYRIKQKIVIPFTKKYEEKLSKKTGEKIKEYYDIYFPEKKELLDKCEECDKYFKENKIYDIKVDIESELDKLIIKNERTDLEDCFQLIFKDKCLMKNKMIDKNVMIQDIINKKIHILISKNEKDIINKITSMSDDKLKEIYEIYITQENNEKKGDDDILEQAIYFFVELKKKKVMSDKMRELNEKGIEKLRKIAIKNKVGTDENVNNMLYYDLIKHILKKQKKDLKETKRESNVITNPFYGSQTSKNMGFVINKKPSELSDKELDRFLKKYNYDKLNISRKEKISILENFENNSRHVIRKDKEELINKLILLSGIPGVNYINWNINDLQNKYIELEYN